MKTPTLPIGRFPARVASSVPVLGLVLVLIAVTPIRSARAESDRPVSLAGRWRFQLDREDAGVDGRWFGQDLPGTVRLPGDLAGQGIGDPVSATTPWTGGIVDRSWFTAPEYAAYRAPNPVKVPFWLQPDRHYVGPAWFQREIEVPGSWEGRRVVLFLERPHWETRVWVDDRFVGHDTSLATPHVHDLGQLTPGRHRLTIRVDNRRIVDVGENSHSISDHTQGNWNGIVGRIELRSTPATWIADLQVHPRAGDGVVEVQGRLGRSPGATAAGTVVLGVHAPRGAGATPEVRVNADAGGRFTAVLALGAPVARWDEFHPALYELRATLTLDGAPAMETRVPFGLRDLRTQGTQFLLNDRPVFFRGTLECAIFPRTGHPPTDVDSWRRIVRVCRAHGLNMIRFHSWCPPEAAFRAADELGFYLHVECSSWANQSTTLGDGKPVDAWIYAETDRILEAYGHHPSFVLLLYGNEPGGPQHAAYLDRWLAHYRGREGRRLISGGAGWPERPGNQFHVVPGPRIQAWGDGLKSRINARPPETTTDYRDTIQRSPVPIISHEIGQWCAYPNFDEIRKYTGYLKPRNFEIFRDRLEAQGLGGLARDFLRASGRLQVLCYKEEIEAALRTPGMGGFQLLDLHDFPGQGTALVGVLDAFWEGKGYLAPEEFRRFCNTTVPLARLPSRVFTTADRLTADLEVAHFGPAPLDDAVLEWRLVDGRGKVQAGGAFPPRALPLGTAVAVGAIDVDLRGLAAPAACRLVAGLRATRFENDWDVWIYPEPPQALTVPASTVKVRAHLDEDAEAHLRAGGGLLLTLPGDRVRNFESRPVRLGFSSIFWNTAWTGHQPPTTLGILCDPRHPALAGFPTDAHSNWQWWYLLHRAGALRLDLLPAGTPPVVRIIDDWFTARSLGLVVEGRVGPGRIVICGFDLTRGADDPVSRQLRDSLVRHLASDGFPRGPAFSLDQVRSLVAPE